MQNYLQTTTSPYTIVFPSLRQHHIDDFPAGRLLPTHWTIEIVQARLLANHQVYGGPKTLDVLHGSKFWTTSLGSFYVDFMDEFTSYH